MKVVLLNGSPHWKGCTYTALNEVRTTLESEGIATDMLWVGNGPVAGCTACGYCDRHDRCVVDDQVNTLLDMPFDALVVGSPVYYGAASGQVTCFLNRLFFAGSARMAGRFGAAVVSCRRGGATATFDQLNKYFTIANMPVVPSQYWNQVHGNTPEQVKQDLEGLQTMRTLARNLAWLLRLKQAGQDAGVAPPAREPRVSTNFIR
ncbi:MAG: flavodoxin family protein [Christensenellales bacterium]|jgi:multimeric flavodoxin WrbA